MLERVQAEEDFRNKLSEHNGHMYTPECKDMGDFTGEIEKGMGVIKINRDMISDYYIIGKQYYVTMETLERAFDGELFHYGYGGYENKHYLIFDYQQETRDMLLLVANSDFDYGASMECSLTSSAVIRHHYAVVWKMIEGRVYMNANEFLELYSKIFQKEYLVGPASWKLLQDWIKEEKERYLKNKQAEDEEQAKREEQAKKEEENKKENEAKPQENPENQEGDKKEEEKAAEIKMFMGVEEGGFYWEGENLIIYVEAMEQLHVKSYPYQENRFETPYLFCYSDKVYVDLVGNGLLEEIMKEPPLTFDTVSNEEFSIPLEEFVKCNNGIEKEKENQECFRFENGLLWAKAHREQLHTLSVYEKDFEGAGISFVKAGNDQQEEKMVVSKSRILDFYNKWQEPITVEQLKEIKEHQHFLLMKKFDFDYPFEGEGTESREQLFSVHTLKPYFEKGNITYIVGEDEALVYNNQPESIGLKNNQNEVHPVYPSLENGVYFNRVRLKSRGKKAEKREDHAIEDKNEGKILGTQATSFCLFSSYCFKKDPEHKKLYYYALVKNVGSSMAVLVRKNSGIKTSDKGGVAQETYTDFMGNYYKKDAVIELEPGETSIIMEQKLIPEENINILYAQVLEKYTLIGEIDIYVYATSVQGKTDLTDARQFPEKSRVYSGVGDYYSRYGKYCVSAKKALAGYESSLYFPVSDATMSENDEYHTMYLTQLRGEETILVDESSPDADYRNLGNWGVEYHFETTFMNETDEEVTFRGHAIAIYTMHCFAIQSGGYVITCFLGKTEKGVEPTEKEKEEGKNILVRRLQFCEFTVPPRTKVTYDYQYMNLANGNKGCVIQWECIKKGK